MFEYYFHLASKWYGFKQAYVVPLVYKKKNIIGENKVVYLIWGVIIIFLFSLIYE